MHSRYAKPQTILKEQPRGVDGVVSIEMGGDRTVLVGDVHALPGVDVDHTGEDDLAGHVEHAGVVGNLDVRADRGNLAVLDQHRALGDRFPNDRDNPTAGERHLVRRAGQRRDRYAEAENR